MEHKTSSERFDIFWKSLKYCNYISALTAKGRALLCWNEQESYYQKRITELENECAKYNPDLKSLLKKMNE